VAPESLPRLQRGAFPAYVSRCCRSSAWWWLLPSETMWFRSDVTCWYALTQTRCSAGWSKIRTLLHYCWKTSGCLKYEVTGKLTSCQMLLAVAILSTLKSWFYFQRVFKATSAFTVQFKKLRCQCWPTELRTPFKVRFQRSFVRF